MNNCRIFTCFVIAMGISPMLCPNTMATIVWDANGGVGGDWHEPLNWTGADGETDNSVPVPASAVRLSSACSDESPVTIASDEAVAASLIVGPRVGAVNYYGYLSIETNLTMSGAFKLHEKGKGYVIHNAGTLTCGTFNFASSTSTEGTGTYDLTGSGAIHIMGDLTTGGGTGTVLIQRGADTDVQIDGGVTSGDYPPGVPWCYRLESGSLTINGTVSRKYGAWIFDQSGGAALIGGSLNLGIGYRSPGTNGEPFEWIISGDASLSVMGNVQMGNTDLDRVVTTWGRFTLKGSKAEGSDALIGGDWRQTGTNTTRVVGTRGVLKAVIDDAAIADPSAMRKVVITTGTVTFDNGSMVQPEFDLLAIPTVGTWTLMTWLEGKVINNGLVLEESVDPTVWSFAVTSTGLTVTYRPRPTLICIK